MSAAPAAAGRDEDTVSRRGVVVACGAAGLAVRWTEAVCRGCVGCGGRCALFAKAPGDTEILDGIDIRDVAPGVAVDVTLPARGLRRGATAAYGLAALSILVGAALGHGLGSMVDAPNGGAFLGLLAGTFAAGWITKRSAPIPRLAVRVIPNSVPTGDA